MPEKFEVLDISKGYEFEEFEQLGTKAKCWVIDANETKFLFKQGRKNTGENWAEVVACEIAEILGLPHATYHLALDSDDKAGVLTKSFVPPNGRLVHGNELLLNISKSPVERRRRSSMKKHSITRVRAVTRKRPLVPIGWTPIPGVESAEEVFCGYLLLDALIANQDRHYENWGYIFTENQEAHLAPTFDHASSLGRNETEENMKERLETKDKGRSIERYVLKASSAMYASQEATRPLSTIGAFSEWGQHKPDAALAWLGQLEKIPDDVFHGIMARVPSELITGTATEFASRMLKLNKQRLIDTKDQFL